MKGISGMKVDVLFVIISRYYVEVKKMLFHVTVTVNSMNFYITDLNRSRFFGNAI